MNITTVADELKNTEESPGAELARIREKKGFTREYVAGKLHLRVRLIELLEKDEYAEMPEPVFIMGYLRAYAKLLSIAPDPLIAAFKNLYSITDRKPEKALWQSKRESNKGEWVVRVLTAMVAISAMVAIAFWWQKGREDQPLVSGKNKGSINTAVLEVEGLKLPNHPANNTATIPESKLSQVSKLQSMFSAETGKAKTEKANG